jgi:hypothetical protein
MDRRTLQVYRFLDMLDIKFLTLADKIWKIPFVKLSLSQSYRLTNQISWFVNNIMLNKQRIKTIKSGPKVDYFIGNSFLMYKKIGKYIRNIIEKENILASDIFILVPSVKTSESPYKKLENYLVKHKIKCTTPSSDDAKLDEKIISNKVVFTTYHQSKGRERKVVILYNFDDSYIEYYNKNSVDMLSCPNILYVGATRASWKLILIHDSRNKPLGFLNLSKLKSNQFLNVEIIDKQIISYSHTKNSNIKKITVTDLVKFISSLTIDILIKIIESNNLFYEVKPIEKIINIPNKIKIEYKDNKDNLKEKILNKNIIWEDISDLNGLVIPAIYEKIVNKSTSTIENYVKNEIENNVNYDDIKKYMGKINIPASSINDFLKIGNIYLSMQNKLHARIAQIKKYNWLNLNLINEFHSRMEIITSNTKFEIILCNKPSDDFIEYDHEEFGPIHIKGRLDALDNNIIWEFKCVDNITIEHKLQLIIYWWLWNTSKMVEVYGKKEFCLFNIKSGQIIKLNDNYSNTRYTIEQIFEILLQEKYLTKKNISDKDFINICNNYMSNDKN